MGVAAQLVLVQRVPVADSIGGRGELGCDRDDGKLDCGEQCVGGDVAYFVSGR
jgi:hypothetical protein